MKKSFLIIILLLSSSSALAEWSWVKSVSLGRTEMDIVDFQPFLGTTFKTVNTITYSTLNLALTGVQDKFFFSVNTDIPFSDSSYVFSEQGSDTVRTVERKNLALTLGYRIYKGLNLYGGLSYDASHFFNDSISNPGGVTDVKEKDSGPFFGVIYGHNFSHYGSVSVTIAYALLDGEISSNEAANSFTNNSGDTTGFSFALIYSNKYNVDLNYFISAKIKNYEYDNVSRAGVDVDMVKEKYYFLFSAGLNIL